jgi:hypothetical protein
MCRVPPDYEQDAQDGIGKFEGGTTRKAE